MKKTIINIIGNICSGKSTLLKLAKRDIDDATYFSIDEYREKHGSFDFNSDKLVWGKLIKDVENHQFSIVESSGTSKFFYQLNDTINFNVITILLLCSKDICLERYKNREPTGLQIADKFDIEDSLNYISNKLLFTKKDYIINSNQEPEYIYKEFLKIIKTIK